MFQDDNSLRFSFGWEMAGFLSIFWKYFDINYCIHFFPEKQFQLWGKRESWYDGPTYEFGLGSFVLITKM